MTVSRSLHGSADDTASFLFMVDYYFIPLECNFFKAEALVLFIEMSQVPGSVPGTQEMMLNNAWWLNEQKFLSFFFLEVSFHVVRALKRYVQGVDDSFWTIRGDSIDNVAFEVDLEEFIVLL